MPRQVVWSRRALNDLEHQLDFIEQRSPGGAKLVADRIEAAVQNLAFLAAGRRGRMSGTRERHVEKTSVVILFRLPDEDTMRILRIVHTSRHWPPGAWPAS